MQHTIYIVNYQDIAFEAQCKYPHLLRATYIHGCILTHSCMKMGAWMLSNLPSCRSKLNIIDKCVGIHCLMCMHSVPSLMDILSDQSLPYHGQ